MQSGIVTANTRINYPGRFSMSQFRFWHYPVVVGAIAIAIFGSAKLILSTLHLGIEASPLWLPAGIALAAVFWQGRLGWLGVALGIALFNGSMGVSWVLAGGSVLGNTLQAIAGAMLLHQVGFRVPMERLRDVLGFVVVAVLTTPVMNATISTLTAISVGQIRWEWAALNWGTMWLGDSMGILVVAPVLLTAFSHSVSLPKSAMTLWKFWRPRHALEGGLWLGLLVVVSVTVFYSHPEPAIAAYPLEYLPFPLVIWAALRFKPATAVLASFILSAIAISGTALGYGPFVHISDDSRQIALLVQAFMGIVTITALLLAAITAERQRTEDLLRHSEASLANAQRLALLGNWDFDLTQAQWRWSAELYRLLGLSPHRIKPSLKTFLQAVHPSDREQVQHAIAQALEQRQPYQMDYRILLPDRSERIVREQVEIGTTSANGTVQDITEQKRVEEQLRLTAERNRLLGEMALRIRQSLNVCDIVHTTVEEVRQFLQADRVFICRFDQQGQGKVVAESVLPGWTSVMGWSTDAEVYQEIQSLFQGDRIQVINDTSHVEPSPFIADYYHRYQIRAGIGVPIVLDGRSRACATATQQHPLGHSQASAETSREPADARLFGLLIVNQCSSPRQWRPVEIELLEQLATQVAIAIQQGQLYQEVQTLNANLEQQVTERTLQLQKNMAELEDLNQFRDVFLHAVAHDLRTTVMGTLMVLKNLQNQPGEIVPISRPTLERMTQSGEVQLNKLNSLLEAYTNKTEGILLDRQAIELPSLLEPVLAELSPLMQQNQVILVNQVNSTELPPLVADTTQLQRVFKHLLTNAVKHNLPGVQITLRAIVEAGMVRCTVEDNGKGLSPAQCDRLFDLRQNHSSERQLMGISLGLCICHQIITAHGGKIGVNSNPGNGSAFWFTLPLAKA